MMDAAEIADLRRCSDEALPDTATIERATYDVWDAVQTGVACRMAPISQRNGDRDLAVYNGSGNVRVVQLPALTDVAVDDRVVILGHTYGVVDVPAPRSDEIARRIIVRELG